MRTIKRFLRRLLGSDRPSMPALWPRTKQKPRVLYEVDQKFHLAYDQALDITRMRNVAMRRQRYYTFRYLLHGVAQVPGDVCEVGCYRGLSAHLIASTSSVRHVSQQSQLVTGVGRFVYGCHFGKQLKQRRFLERRHTQDL